MKMQSYTKLFLQKVLRKSAAAYLSRKKSVGSSKYYELADIRLSDDMQEKLPVNIEERKFYLGVWYCKNGYGWRFYAAAEYLKDKVFPVLFPWFIRVWKWAMRFELVRRIWEWLTA